MTLNVISESSYIEDRLPVNTHTLMPLLVIPSLLFRQLPSGSPLGVSDLEAKADGAVRRTGGNDQVAVAVGDKRPRDAVDDNVDVEEI